jgi:hypothetical protein
MDSINGRGVENMAQHEERSKLTEKTLDLERARQSLIEELEAINWYQERIDATEEKSLQDILAHNRDEEKEHAAMLIEWIRRQDPEFNEELDTYLFTKEDITEIEEE